MVDSDDVDFWYPTVEDVLTIHGDIIEEGEGSEPGVRDPDQIQYAIDHVMHGHFGEGPETIHEKAFDLMRLLAANHWFVDGNKRTALNTTAMFYVFNGYDLEYGEDLRSMLKLLSVREELIDRDVAVEYLSEQTEPLSLDELDDEETLILSILSIAKTILDEHTEAIDGNRNWTDRND